MGAKALLKGKKKKKKTFSFLPYKGPMFKKDTSPLHGV
jgi:hypothetical protein